jgi:DNA-binding GntR family transcriptional regulator
LARSRGPSHRRIADDLRVKISSGEYPVGSRIPSTPQLINSYGVSKTAVRQAVTKLQEEGLLEGVDGVGVEVIATPQSLAQEQADIESFNARIEELSAEVKSIAERVPRDVAQQLEDLTAKFGALQTHLIELYGRLGQPYPNNVSSDGARKTGS